MPRYRCPSPSSPECGAEGIAVKEGYSRLRESIQMVTGPSIDEFHLHVGPELAVLHVFEALFVHLGQKQLVGVHREGRFCGLIKLGR